jgi:hypothetical protein
MTTTYPCNECGQAATHYAVDGSSSHWKVVMLCDEHLRTHTATTQILREMAVVYDADMTLGQLIDLHGDHRYAAKPLSELGAHLETWREATERDQRELNTRLANPDAYAANAELVRAFEAALDRGGLYDAAHEAGYRDGVADTMQHSPKPTAVTT